MCVTRRAHKEGRNVSKQRIRKDNRERVRRQGKKSSTGCVCVCEFLKKKHFINVMKEVMRSATTNEDSTGAEREEAKGLIDYI